MNTAKLPDLLTLTLLRTLSLPRVLVCSQCGHGTFIKGGRPARSRSVERDEQAAQRAAWEQYEAADVGAAARLVAL